MSFLLHIDTAVEGASFCFSKNGVLLAGSHSPETKDSAAWLHPAIRRLCRDNDFHLNDLNAISISGGPGSYTGLRVGMAAAKGLCYALNIPLISINTLKMMAVSGLKEDYDLLCPMIDARRQEVFTAVFDKQLNEVIAPHNMVLSSTSFRELLMNHRIVFFGNGSLKFASHIGSFNAHFKTLTANAEQLIPLAEAFYQQKKFVSLAYSEPYYGKDFYSHADPERKK